MSLWGEKEVFSGTQGSSKAQLISLCVLTIYEIGKSARLGALSPGSTRGEAEHGRHDNGQEVARQNGI